MKRTFRRLIDEATRLTRAGDLRAATAAIRSAMQPPDPSDTIEAPMVAESVATASERPASRAPGSRMPLPHQPDAPTSGRFVAGVHADASGRREYKLYIPPGAGGRPLPLIVMLHGCTQDPDDFAAGTAMNEAAYAQGFFVLYPAQSLQINPQRCWNWFKHNHQSRGHGEPSLIVGMARETMHRYAIDGERIYVAGLSAGGAMAAILGDTYPDVFAAVGVHSGLPTGAAMDLKSALAAMQSGATPPRQAASGMPTIVFHGDADTRVHPRNGEQVIAASAGTDTTIEIEHCKGPGHGWTRRVHHDADGSVVAEHWTVHGAAHAWSGGRPAGSYTDASGPDASGEMLRFFFEHRRRKAH